MRLIDADKLKYTLLEYNYTTENNQIFRYIEEQPTAYDIDKVVEELKERTDFLKYCTKYGNKNAKQQAESYSTMMMYEVDGLVDDLIEIVKQGGVYKRMKHQREEFERDLHETPDLIYTYMLDRVVNAPTKMHMTSSIILLMPVLRRLLQEEKND